MYLYFIPVQCEVGELRVVGGTANSGRVEVCILEEWHSPCVREWTANNTKVVCRQLGFASTGMPLKVIVMPTVLTTNIKTYCISNSRSITHNALSLTTNTPHSFLQCLSRMMWIHKMCSTYTRIIKC